MAEWNRVSASEGASVGGRRPYHHGDLRHEVVVAARALVEERGPELFSVAEVCRRAGVSSAAPYRHFADRQEIMDAVAVEGMEDLRAACAAAAALEAPGSAEAVAAIGRAYVGFAAANPAVFRMMFAAHGESLALVEAGRRAYSVLLEQVAAWMAARGIEGAVEEAAFPLWTFVHGLSFLYIDGKVGFCGMEGKVDTVIGRAAEGLLPR